MKSFRKAIVGLGLLAVLAPSISSCSKQADGIYVYVYNAEDYIDEGLIDTFQDYVRERDNKNVFVIYETYDTNETMYNTLKTGKQTYDAICCSDYMIQRLAREGLTVSFEDAFSKDYFQNYQSYVAPFLATYDDSNLGKLDTIPVDIPNSEEKGRLSDYAVGYMWGTLGILYNPELIIQKNHQLLRQIPGNEHATDEELIEYIVDDFNSVDGWSALWKDAYRGTQSIKDSMRDTYAVGILEYYKDYFLEGSDKYLTDYEARNEQFNKCDDETIKGVEGVLIDLKQNIFGFEVDSGKDDIVNKKIGVNIAWSGDAVNSIGRGFYADLDMTIERSDENKINLYYATPALGANIWFDAWCLPKHNEEYYESDEYKYAMEFLDFLSDPANAVDNSSYNGYTSFIGSTTDSIDMLNYILYSYDLSADAEDLDELDEYDISYYFDFKDEDGNPLADLSLEVYDPFEEEEEEPAEEEPPAEEEESATEEEETFIYNFTDEDGDGKLDIIVRTDLTSFEGRSLVAQYPASQNINGLYVMRDFGSQNNKIVSMWENVKVNPLPVWIIVTLVTFLVVVFGYLGSYKLIRAYKIKKRKEFRKLNSEN